VARIRRVNNQELTDILGVAGYKEIEVEAKKGMPIVRSMVSNQTLQEEHNYALKILTALVRKAGGKVSIPLEAIERENTTSLELILNTITERFEIYLNKEGT
jgi:hypothetical protein